MSGTTQDGVNVKKEKKTNLSLSEVATRGRKAAAATTKTISAGTRAPATTGLAIATAAATVDDMVSIK